MTTPARYQPARWSWLREARHSQLTPVGDWNVWLLLAGRGFGKTRTGAEDIANYCVTNSGVRVAVVAPTHADARDTCVEGDSGLLAVLRRYGAVQTWNRSLGELILTNGSRIKLFSADEPERLRGPQHHRAWCDELAAWRYPEAWDQLQFGLRLGTKPQVIVTTTPKNTRHVRDLTKRPDVHITTGSTFDNAANLAPTALAQLQERYANTRLGRQELSGELLTDVEGALVRQEWIDNNRRSTSPVPERIVVALDPADGRTEGDEQGLAVASISDGRYYVLHSEGSRLTPDAWIRRAVSLAEHYHADALVYEKNHGAAFLTDLVRKLTPDTLRTIPVTATHGKRTRFEPIAALYEQGKVSHVGVFEQLEEQLTTYTGGPGERSPDRLDAAVWALTDLAGARQPVFLGAA